MAWTAAVAACRSARDCSSPSSRAVSFLRAASASSPTSHDPRSSATNTTPAAPSDHTLLASTRNGHRHLPRFPPARLACSDRLALSALGIENSPCQPIMPQKARHSICPRLDGHAVSGECEAKLPSHSYNSSSRARGGMREAISGAVMAACPQGRRGGPAASRAACSSDARFAGNFPVPVLSSELAPIRHRDRGCPLSWPRKAPCTPGRRH